MNVVDRSTQIQGGITPSATETFGLELRPLCFGDVPKHVLVPVSDRAGGRRECLEELESLQRWYARRGKDTEARAIKAAIRRLKK